MPRKTWTLTDVDADIYVDRISLGPEQAGGSAGGYSRDQADPAGRAPRRGRRGRGGQRAIALCCGADPRHGPLAGELRRYPTRLEVAGPRPAPPAFVPLWEPSGIGWLSGFDELLVRCGLESNGGPEFLPNGSLRYPLHGKIANIPAHQLERDN